MSQKLQRRGLTAQFRNASTNKYELHVYNYWTGEVDDAYQAETIERLREINIRRMYKGPESVADYAIEPSEESQLFPVVTQSDSGISERSSVFE